MLKPEKPPWQFSALRAGFVVLAVPIAAGLALVVWRLSVIRLISPTLGFVALLITFVVFSALFYFLLVWLSNRLDEVAKSVPTDSKELRRKRKSVFRQSGKMIGGDLFTSCRLIAKQDSRFDSCLLLHALILSPS